jgi:hypothetical protein
MLCKNINYYFIDPAGMVPRKTAYLGSMPSTDGMGKRG